MIAGNRLRGMLAFQADAVRNEISSISRRLLGLDRDLNMLRAAEVAAWKDYGLDGPQEASQVSDFARKVIEARHATALSAMETLGSAEIEIAASVKPLAAAREAAAIAKEGYASAERSALEGWRGSEQLASARGMLEAIALRMREIRTWEKTASERLAAAMNAVTSDPVRSYLRSKGWGENHYRGGAIARVGDRFAASASGYGRAADICRELREYLQSCEEWREACVVARNEAGQTIRAGEESVLDRLDGPRAALADALNRLDKLESSVERLERDRREAMNELLEIVQGRDETHAKMIDVFAKAMAAERSAAMQRMADLGVETPDPAVGARIDGIVADRIRLSIETDGLRKHVSQALRRLVALLEVCALVDGRGWNAPSVLFDLEEDTFLPQDVAGGRMGVSEAMGVFGNALDAVSRGEAPASPRDEERSVGTGF